MANYSNLKTAIENAVDWNNGDNEITGQNLLDILETIIDSLGAKYKFADVATPSSSITTPDEPLFYLAGAGTYTNFGGLSVTIPRGTLAIFYYDTAWHYTTVRTDSDALFNVNQYLGAPSTTYTKANGRNAVPSALRSKGMIITYLTTNGWLIEQNLSTSGTWNADANWQTIGPVSVSQNTLMIGGEDVLSLDNITGVIKHRFCGDSAFSNGKGYIIPIQKGDVIYIKAPSTNACTFAYLSGYSDSDVTPQIIGARHSIYAGYEIADSDKVAPANTKYIWINLLSSSGNSQTPETATINNVNIFSPTFNQILSIKRESEEGDTALINKTKQAEKHIGIIENEYVLKANSNFGVDIDTNIGADGNDIQIYLAVPSADISQALNFNVLLTYIDDTTEDYFAYSNTKLAISYYKEITRIRISLYGQGSSISNDTTLTATINGGGLYSTTETLKKDIHTINTKIEGYLYKYLLSTSWGDGESVIFKINEGDRVCVVGNGLRGTFAFLSEIQNIYGQPVYSNVEQGEDGRFVVDDQPVMQIAPANTQYLCVNKLRNGNNVYPSQLLINELDANAYIIQNVYKIAQKLERADTTDVSILAPDNIHAVVGTKVNICFDSVVTKKDFSQLSRAFSESSFIQVDNEAECTVGSNEIDAKITAYLTPLYKVQHPMTIKPIATNVGANTTWNVLCLGESTTDNPYVVKDLNDIFADDVMDINLIGSKENPVGIKNEGRGGWTLGNYRHDAEHAGVINPFYNPATQDFDFSYYRTTYNIPAPDVVIIYMGINDTAQNKANFITDYDYIINSIKSDTPAVKIVVCPPNVCSCVKSTWTYRQNYKVHLQDTIKELMEHYGNREDENIYLCCAYVAVNPIYDMEQLQERVISSFNPAFKGLYIPVNTGDVHPSEYGYMKIATWWYNTIKYISSL